jgi:hypothetical protein
VHRADGTTKSRTNLVVILYIVKNFYGLQNERVEVGLEKTSLYCRPKVISPPLFPFNWLSSPYRKLKILEQAYILVIASCAHISGRINSESIQVQP